MKKVVLVLWMVLLSLPLSLAAQGSPPITAENASNLTLIDTLGKGALLDVQLIDGGQTLAALSTGGVTLLNSQDLSEIRYLPFTENYLGRYRYATFLTLDTPPVYQNGIAAIFLNQASDRGEITPIRVDMNLETGEQQLVDTTALMPPPGAISPDERWHLLTPVFRVGQGQPTPGYSLDLQDTTTGETRILDSQAEAILVNAGFTSDGSRLITVARFSPSQFLTQVWEVESGQKLAEAEIGSLNTTIGGQGLAVLESDFFVVYDAALTEIARVENIEPVTQKRQASAVVYVHLEDDTLYGVWDLVMLTERTPITRPDCYNNRLNALLNGDTLYLYYMTGAGAIYAHDLNTGEWIADVGGFGSFPAALATRDNLLYVGGGDIQPQDCSAVNPSNGVEIFDLTTGNRVGFLPSQVGAVNHLAISETGRLATTRYRGVDVFDSQGALEFSIANDEFNLFLGGVDFTPTESSVVLSANEQARVYPLADPATPSLVLPDSITQIVWVNFVRFYGEILVTAQQSNVVIYDTTGGVVTTFSHDLPVTAFDVNKNTGTLAVLTGNFASEGQEVFLYNLNTLELVTQFTLPAFPAVSFITLSPDDTLIALAQPNGDFVFPGTVIYDTGAGTLVTEVKEMSLPIVFSEDGTRLIGAFGNSLIVYGLE